MADIRQMLQQQGAPASLMALLNSLFQNQGGMAPQGMNAPASGSLPGASPQSGWGSPRPGWSNDFGGAPGAYAKGGVVPGGLLGGSMPTMPPQSMPPPGMNAPVSAPLPGGTPQPGWGSPQPGFGGDYGGTPGAYAKGGVAPGAIPMRPLPAGYGGAANPQQDARIAALKAQYMMR